MTLTLCSWVFLGKFVLCWLVSSFQSVAIFLISKFVENCVDLKFSKTVIKFYHPPKMQIVIEKFGLSRDIMTVFKYNCREDHYLIGKPFHLCSNEGIWKKLFCCIDKDRPQTVMNRKYPSDCNAIPAHCGEGYYTISPAPTVSFNVYCIMRRNDPDRNWHVIQWRRYEKTDFEKNWDEYENSIGDVDNDLWLGNKKIHYLTSIGNNRLNIELKPYEGESKMARYGGFYVGDANDKYRLLIKKYLSGKAGDNLMDNHNGTKFSTFDQYNDSKRSIHYGKRYKSGWWFNADPKSNLNGLYGSKGWPQGIQWYSITGRKFSIKESRMIIRPS